jgi:hypothetical protein
MLIGRTLKKFSKAIFNVCNKVKQRVETRADFFAAIFFQKRGSNMRKTIIQLLEYGWPDKIISNYLMVKPTIVKYYRKKHGIYRNEYQGFY